MLGALVSVFVGLCGLALSFRAGRCGASQWVETSLLGRLCRRPRRPPTVPPLAVLSILMWLGFRRCWLLLLSSFSLACRILGFLSVQRCGQSGTRALSRQGEVPHVWEKDRQVPQEVSLPDPQPEPTTPQPPPPHQTTPTPTTHKPNTLKKQPFMLPA